ncbi:MAG: disulfide bond formation protein B [Pelomonas sp.]|nr:disulfide bond formation protein B [Roseateles sp.]
MRRAAPALSGRVLAGTLLVSLAAVAAALVAQHAFGVRPCPWCVLQRGVFLLIAAASLVGLLLRGAARGLLLVVVLGLAVAGCAAAYYQHEVASLTSSCAMGFADRTIASLQLEDRLPYVFMVTANCAEAAAYRLLGLPYEVWSGALYVLTALAAALGLKRLK